MGADLFGIGLPVRCGVRERLDVFCRGFGLKQARIGLEIDAVWIHENLGGIDAARDQYVADLRRDNADEGRLLERQCLRLEVLSFVDVAGILEAAPFFHYRLPEAFAGYPRALTEYPVEYPTSCSPQAWATGAPLLLLRVLLGLEPLGNRLLVDPALPAVVGWLTLLDIPGRWGRTDAFGRGKIELPGMPERVN